MTATYEKRTIQVTYDPDRGFVALPREMHPIVALSLSVLRKKIQEALQPADPIITFNLDRAARLERDQRRAACRI